MDIEQIAAFNKMGVVCRDAFNAENNKNGLIIISATKEPNDQKKSIEKGEDIPEETSLLCSSQHFLRMLPWCWKKANSLQGTDSSTSKSSPSSDYSGRSDETSTERRSKDSLKISKIIYTTFADMYEFEMYYKLEPRSEYFPNTTGVKRGRENENHDKDQDKDQEGDDFTPDNNSSS